MGKRERGKEGGKEGEEGWCDRVGLTSGTSALISGGGLSGGGKFFIQADSCATAT